MTAGNQQDVYSAASDVLQSLTAPPEQLTEAEIRGAIRSVVDTWHPAVLTAAQTVYRRLSEQIQVLKQAYYSRKPEGQQQAAALRTQIDELAAHRKLLELAHRIEAGADENYIRVVARQGMQAGKSPKSLAGDSFSLEEARVEEREWKETITHYGMVAFRTNPAVFVESARGALVKQSHNSNEAEYSRL